VNVQTARGANYRRGVPPDLATTPAIVHVVGYPGVGKYTVARALADLASVDGSRIVLVDNHLTSNVIFSVLPVDGVAPLPATVWDRVQEVRDAVLRTIEELSPPEWSFVFTNVLTEGVPGDERVVDRLIELASRRRSRYVPVRLSCRTDELLARVTRPDRRARQKWVDPVGVRAFTETSAVLDIDHPARLDIDVTSLPAREAAARILEHLGSLPA
jgi:hypothetical protein